MIAPLISEARRAHVLRCVSYMFHLFSMWYLETRPRVLKCDRGSLPGHELTTNQALVTPFFSSKGGAQTIPPRYRSQLVSAHFTFHRRISRSPSFHTSNDKKKVLVTLFSSLYKGQLPKKQIRSTAHCRTHSSSPTSTLLHFHVQPPTSMSSVLNLSQLYDRIHRSMHVLFPRIPVSSISVNSQFLQLSNIS